MAEITMSAKAQKIMERYNRCFVTDVQLQKYFQLGVITEEEYDFIRGANQPVIEEEAEPAENEA